MEGFCRASHKQVLLYQSLNMSRILTYILQKSIPLIGDILISFIAAKMNSRDWYEIIGLYKILLSIKQPCSSVCLKKALKMLKKCWNNAVSWLNKAENWIFHPNFICWTASQPAARNFHAKSKIFISRFYASLRVKYSPSEIQVLVVLIQGKEHGENNFLLTHSPP